MLGGGGGMAFYRSHDLRRLKLSCRGIKSIFIGYTKNSKAYKLLELDSNVIVEFRGVEFRGVEFLGNKF